MMNRAHNATRGFTLVELLVVIGVIAVLVALLLPAAMRLRQSAITLKCLSNQRQLGIALQSYASANGAIIPYAYHLSQGLGDGGKNWQWFLAQDPALRNIVAGPLRKVGSTVTPPLPGEYGGTSLKCPNNSRFYGQGAFNGVSYSLVTYNVYSPGTSGAFWEPFPQPSYPNYRFLGLRITSTRNTATSLLAIDSATGGVSPPILMRQYDGGIMPGISVGTSGRGNRGGTEDRVWLAHATDKANVLFLDGHAETCDENRILALGFTSYWNTQGVYHP